MVEVAVEFLGVVLRKRRKKHHIKRLGSVDGLKPVSAFTHTASSGKTALPYALLPHRCGSAEILFEDVNDETYREKVSYCKLLFRA